MKNGVFQLRRHFLVKRADDGGAPKNEWNEEFEDIITDTIPYCKKKNFRTYSDDRLL